MPSPPGSHAQSRKSEAASRPVKKGIRTRTSQVTLMSSDPLGSPRDPRSAGCCLCRPQRRMRAPYLGA